ncbi:hypothetical protein Taro_001853 [Colocasia esculenta]|uniref:Thylakoid lumenal 15 kDa protein 1, chloroplastic n=1 Tax=Colocasia esculenta TaxID=4460 RepID=A0A843TLY1_COLES|nr:hypothetical protein [Colocasia esculenta]
MAAVSISLRSGLQPSLSSTAKVPRHRVPFSTSCRLLLPRQGHQKVVEVPGVPGPCLVALPFEQSLKASAVSLLAASLLFVDPSLAFRACSNCCSLCIFCRRVGSSCFSFLLFTQHLFVRAWSKGGGPYGQEVTRGQDLTGKDFSGKTLIKQDFKTSILRQANFKSAKLLGASFFDADLTGADLSDADLRGADFSLANVTKANLTNANLEGALTTGNTSFRGSIITGADERPVGLVHVGEEKQFLHDSIVLGLTKLRPISDKIFEMISKIITLI